MYLFASTISFYNNFCSQVKDSTIIHFLCVLTSTKRHEGGGKLHPRIVFICGSLKRNILLDPVLYHYSEDDQTTLDPDGSMNQEVFQLELV